MIFLASCPDQVGLVALVSSFFSDRDINIFHLEEHTESGRFFIRVETESGIAKQQLAADFAETAKGIGMEYSFFDIKATTKIALFCSSTLHCPLEIISRQLSGALPVEVVCIISNSKAVEPIAEKFAIPFFFTPTDAGGKPETEQLEIMRRFSIDLITLGRYMKVLSPDFLAKAPAPIINIHHSFLPSFIGGKPYEMAYERGVKMVGATAHFVTEQLDEGPIIAQGILPVDHSFTIERMKREGENIEKDIFAEAIRKFSRQKILVYGKRTVVFR